MRPETGPMQFDDDWRGIFIRGDDAFGYITMLKILQDQLPEDKKDMFILIGGLDGLIDLLASSNHHQNTDGVQMMKKFADCRIVKLHVLQHKMENDE